MVRSLASFSTSKLARIVANIKDDADEVDKQAAIIQAASLKTEREKQAEERELADSARGQQNAIYQLQLKEAAAREQDRKRKSRQRVSCTETDNNRRRVEIFPQLAH